MRLIDRNAKSVMKNICYNTWNVEYVGFCTCYYLKCVCGIVIDDSSIVGQYFDHKQFFIYYVYVQDDSLTVIFQIHTDFSWILAIMILLDK